MYPQEYLCLVLHYEPTTGLFTWVKAKSNRVRIGDIAGCLDKLGYIVININRNLYLAHFHLHL
jgi:hypothetical protein